MKAMEYDNTNVWSFTGGALAGIVSYLIKIDWTAFLEQIGPETIKVSVLGVLGGAAGLVGKKIVEKIFFKKKNK